MPFKQIDRYLAKLILVPLVGTLCLAAMLLIMDRMLRLFDFVVSEGGPVRCNSTRPESLIIW